MAFPTTPVLDNFNRADATSLGANWTQLAGSQWIQGNTCVGTGGGSNAVLWAPSTFGPNVEAYYTIAEMPPEGTDILVGVLRNGTFSGYCSSVRFFSAGNNNEQVSVQRLDAGAAVPLAQVDHPPLAVGDAIGYWLNGTTHQCWLRKSGVWSLVSSVSDSTYTGQTDYRLFCTIVRVVSTAGAIDDYGGGNEIAGGARTLLLEPKTVAVTGQPLTLLRSRLVATAPATVAVTGQPLGLLRGYRLLLAPATITVSPQPLAVLGTRRLPLDPATVTVAGSVIALTRTTPSAAALGLDPATVGIIGQPLGLLRGYRLALDPATVAITGSDITLTRTTPRTLALALEPATITVTPQDVALRRALRVALDPATVTVAPQPILAARGRHLVLDPATVTLIGSAITLTHRRVYVLALEPATVLVQAGDVVLKYRRVVAHIALEGSATPLVALLGSATPTVALWGNDDTTDSP